MQRGRVLVANDHGAIEIKKRLTAILEAQGYAVDDLGVNDPASVDYPDVADGAVAAYKAGSYQFGVLCCGTGIGISIAANRHPGVRCALVWDEFTARMAREHNDANFLAFGGRVSYPVSLERILAAFINASFAGARHSQRLEKLDDKAHG